MYSGARDAWPTLSPVGHRSLAFVTESGSAMPRVSLVVELLALACALLVAVAFANAVPLIVIAIVLLALALVRTTGPVLSALAAIAFVMVAVYVTAGISNALGMPLARGVGTGMLVLALVAVVASRGIVPAMAARRDILAVSVMPLTWVGLAALSFWWPGASPRSWAMRGDTANHLLFARDVIEAGGAPFVGANPVPFPHVVLGVAMTGNHHDAAAAMAAHVTAYSLTWHSVLVFNVLLAGLLARSLARASGGSNRVVAAITVASGLIPFSWLYSGYAIDLGFFNTHIAVAALIVSALVARERKRYPLLVLAAQCALATVLTVTWTPVAAVVGVHIVVGVWGVLRSRVSGAWPAAPRSHWWFAVGLLILLAARSVVFVGDYLQAAQDTAAAAGGMIQPPTVVALLLAAGPLLLAAAVKLSHRRVVSEITDVSVTHISLIATYAVMVLLAGSADLYYPQKLLWILMGFGMVVTPAMVVVFALGLRPGYWRRALTFTAIAGAAVVAIAGTSITLVKPTGGTLDPWIRIMAGKAQGGEDRLYDAVVAHSDGKQLLLSVVVSPDIDRDANFWTINMFSQRYPELSSERFDLRLLGYRQLEMPPDEWLCALADAAQAPVRVETLDTLLSPRVQAMCPKAEVLVVTARDSRIGDES